jgi:alpha-amylase
MNDLISIGVAGFRIDGGKHMRPEDLSAILAKVNNIGLAIDPNTGKPFHAKVERPYIFIEVISAAPVWASDYLAIGNVTEFDYGPKVAGKFRDPNQKLAQLKTFPGHPGSANWGLVPSFNAVAFLDNHDNQRGHGNGAWQADGRIANILTFHYDGNLYNLANVFMLAWPYGYPDVMSSYRWPINVQWAGGNFKDVNDWMGPPADGQGHTKDVNCSSEEWVCEHRWDNIAEMVAFRNYTGRQQEDWTVTHWWDNGADQIAFGRNGKGFVVINRGGGSISKEFDTGMPAGQYCEVLHADFNPQTKTCVGVTVQVDKNGKAVFNVGEGQAAAIYGGARVGGS